MSKQKKTILDTSTHLATITSAGLGEAKQTIWGKEKYPNTKDWDVRKEG